MKNKIIVIVAFFIVCFSFLFIFLFANKNWKDSMQSEKDNNESAQVISGEENKKQEENKVDNEALPVGPAGTKDGGYHPIRMEDIEYFENNKNNQ